MKKSIKITLIVAAIIATLILATALLISPVAKWYIEKHSKELTGRQITIEKLRFNIFNGKLRINDIRMLEANDTTRFASMEEYYMDMKLWPLVKQQVSIRQIVITRPDLSIYQDGPRFNFDDLLLRFLSDSTEVEQPKEPSKPWEVGIDDIKINKGHIFYKDMQIGATWGFNDLDATIPGIYFKDKTDVGVLFNFAQGGSLGLQLNYNMDNADYDLQIDLRQLTLNGRLPYIQQMLNVRDLQGLFTAKLHLNGNMQHLTDMYFDGTMDLSRFSMDDMRGDRVMKADSIHVHLTEGSLRHNRFHFSRLYLLGVEGAFELYKDGSTNIEALIKEQPATVETTVPAADTTTYEPMDLRIEDLEIARGAVRIKDNTHLRPFEYRLSNIRMRTGFDMNKPNKITIDAQVQKTGKARIRWEGSLANMDNHDLMIQLTNIDLRDFSGYCEHYTAYPLTNGNLSFRSHNIIKNRGINGTNHLDVFEPKADKKRKELTPEFNIPLRLGLYVLKDRKGHVKIDLPVHGNIDSPEFSYRKIVFKTLGNMFVKVITSPFSFLSGNKDNLEYIDIEALQYGFTSEQYAKFDKLAEMMRDKPEMKVVLTQRINYPKALQKQEQNNLKMAFYNHLRQADTTATHTPLTMLEYEKIQDMSFKADSVLLFADSLIRLQGGDPSKLNPAQKAEVLYAQKAAEQLSALFERRNAAVVTYLTGMQGIPAASIRATTMSDDQLKAYTGRERYTLGMEVEGETAEVSSHPDDVKAAREAMGMTPEEPQAGSGTPSTTAARPQ